MWERLDFQRTGGTYFFQYLIGGKLPPGKFSLGKSDEISKPILPLFLVKTFTV